MADIINKKMNNNYQIIHIKNYKMPNEERIFIAETQSKDEAEKIKWELFRKESYAFQMRHIEATCYRCEDGEKETIEFNNMLFLALEPGEIFP